MVIKGCTIIDCTGREPYVGDVEVLDGRITRIGRELSAEKTIDAKGKYLIPGLINLHVHINRRNVSRTTASFRMGAPAIENSSDFHRMLFATRNAWYELSTGVTTLRDLCSVGRTATALKEAIEQGIIRGPRLYVCGLGVATVGGHETHRYKGATESGSIEELIKNTENEVKNGADFIKAMASGGIGGMPEHEHPSCPELSREELSAVVSVAHKHGKGVTVHAMGAEPVMNSLLAGVDGIEHGAHLTERALDLMAERGVYYVPTASGIRSVAEKERKNGNLPLADIIYREVIEPQTESIKRAKERGILIGAGTDTLGNLIDELKIFEDVGFTRYEALMTATSNAAKILENDDIGTVECGKIADLVLLSANPLDGLSNLEKIELVLLSGESVDEKWMCNLQ